MNFNNLRFILPVAGLVVAGTGFAGGMATEKALSGPDTTQAASSQMVPGASGQMPDGQGSRPIFGTVTAVDGSTITVVDSMSGATSKISLASSATVTDGTTITDASTIKAGVMVAAFGTTGTDGVLTATRVQINPTMAPAGQGTTGAPSTGSAGGTGI